ncbi:hypothetical protein [Curtobacterium sp. UCD-KPL2560]|uniref:type IV pilus modification PilV family protein n=1 Tax=Curtobacterium sp. UCD-KPL2560 TaxID=1885315 RepID=UPI000824F4F7|nr:hypothetical protein [Curtobacterium sp. UCD-KPL2560]
MLRLTALLRDAREHDDGVSIVEVLVAMTVFAMIAAGVAMGIASSLYLTHGSRSREVAIGLAQDGIDRARTSTNLFGVVDGTSVQRVAGIDYRVVQTARWVASSGTANACGSGGGPLAYKRVAMTISWSAGGRGSDQSVAMNSMVAPTSAVTAAGLGTIIVSVSRVDGSGNQGAMVSIAPAATNPDGAGPVTSTVPVTDATGCSYALNVKPGRYDVSVTKPGNIDDGTSSGSLGAQTATPSTTVRVSANQTAAANMNYDTALTVAPQWGDPNAPTTAFTAPTTMPVTLRRKTADQGPFAVGTTTQVFPFTDGYKAVAGVPATCASTDPENWTTGSGTAVAPRSPGQPVAGTNAVRASVQLVTITLPTNSVNEVLANSVAPVPNSGDPGCAKGAQYRFTKLPLGQPVTIALPYGTWSLQSGRTAVNLLGIITITTPTTVTGIQAAPGVAPTADRVLLDPRRAP